MKPSADDRALTVITGETTFRLLPGETLTFGRAESCTLCLDADDAAISRLAGEVEHVGEVWFVTNRSTSRPFSVVDGPGLRRVLAPGQRDALEGRVRVIVDGTNAKHELVFQAPPPRAGAPGAMTGLPTAAGQDVVINDADRLALVALFAGYLQEGRRYDPSPRSYEAAAKRLGWPRTTLVKRVEYIRTRLTNAGVPNLQGWNALSALAEYALTTKLITPQDLHLIGLGPRSEG
jgi:hypothetical protein